MSLPPNIDIRSTYKCTLKLPIKETDGHDRELDSDSFEFYTLISLICTVYTESLWAN